MRSKGYTPGRWYVVCDRCGFRYLSDQLKKEWTGLMVCDPCWEPRHPQDLIRIREETAVPTYVRPESEIFEYVCTEYTRQGRADIGEADCAQADYVSRATFT